MHPAVLVTIEMGRKLGRGALPPTWGCPYLTVAWAEAYLHAACYLDPCSHLAATDMGAKIGGGAVPLWGSGTWDPI